jgi:hypothetical protein
VNRRGFLLTVGATTVIAGCASNGNDSATQDTATSEPTTRSTSKPTSEPTTEPTEEPTPEPTTESTSEPTTESTSEPTTESTPEPTTESTPEPTTNTPSGPDLNIQSQSLSTADTPFHNTYAEAIVENEGGTECGTIELTAKWFDDSGSLIGEDTTFLPSLDAGETWVARVGTSTEKEKINEFELDGEYEVSPGDLPDGLTIANSSLNVEDEYSGTITSEVENDRDKSLLMVSFKGLIYNEEGQVIGGRETREADISPNEDLSFDVSLSSTRTVHRISKAVDHSILVTESESSNTENF